MSDIHGFHVDELEFTRAGEPADAHQVDRFLDGLTRRAPSDLLILSHGWNNDMDQARDLYAAWLGVIRTAADRRGWTDHDRTVDVLAVLWPSKQFADADLIAGGAAGLGNPLDDLRLLDAQIASLDGIASVEDIAALRGLAPRLETDSGARDEFVRLVAGIVADTETDAVVSDALPPLHDKDGALLEDLGPDADAVGPPGGDDQGGAAVLPRDGGGADEGGAADVGDVVDGIVSGARNLLNYLTYYKMKNRAGLVGRRGLAPIIARINATPTGPRIHLVGHSFGGRLVTSAVLGPPAGPVNEVSSLVLLQAAFSHNSFATHFDGNRDGDFRSVIAPKRAVSGPIMISHTVNDKAVGIAYAIASKVANQDAAAIGGPNDRFGGLGRNGAVHTPEADFQLMLGAGKDYEHLGDHPIRNLRADRFIKGHGDVRGPEVGEVIVQAVATAS